MKKLPLCLLILALFTGCDENTESNDPAETPPAVEVVPQIPYRVLNYYPHDSSMFTEGLLFHDGKLYESTGSPQEMPGAKSIIAEVSLPDGKVTQKAALDPVQYFGEGIAFLNGKVFQLTYTTRKGFIYDAKSFTQTGTFTYNNAEGWGLTTDGNALIMSDGTSTLTWLDPATQQPVKTVNVNRGGAPVDKLNELEYIKGFIYANIWTTNTIVKIDTTGKVVGELDLSSVAFEAKNKNPGADVMNGIAWDPGTDRIMITGKLWKNIYQIDFAH